MGIQSDLLSFVAQQAIAHAAIIFATFSAAFTFATGFRNTRGRGTQLYVLILTIVLTMSIYAAFRLYFYSVLANAVLNTPPTLTSVIEYYGLITPYWQNTIYPIAVSNWAVSFLGIGMFLQSLTLAGVFGFILAVSITSYLSYDKPALHGFAEIYGKLNRIVRFGFCWAVLNYLLMITLVALLVKWQPFIGLVGTFISVGAIIVSSTLSVVGAAFWMWRGHWPHTRNH